jgi:hypothetical protein
MEVAVLLTMGWFIGVATGLTIGLMLWWRP